MATDDQTVRVIFEAVDRYTNVAGRVQQNMQAMSGSAKQLVVSSQAVGQVTGWEDLEAKLLSATGGMNAASAGAVQVASAQTAAGHAAAAAGSQIERAMSGQAAPSIQNVASKAMGLVKQFTVLSGAIVGFGYTLKKALDFAEAGSRVINLERSFESFAATAGTTGNAVLEAMVTASNGMLSEAQAMQQYSRTYLLAGQEIANQMPQMIKVALAASAAGMGDFNYMIESLVTGLGRLSPLILDNLGLSISLEEAYASYARTIGKTTDELSKGEQQMAVWTQVQEQMVAKIGDLDEATAAMAGQGIAQLKAAWSDFVDYAETRVAPALDDIAGGLADIVKALPESLPSLTTSAEDIERLSAAGERAAIPVRDLGRNADEAAIDLSRLGSAAISSASATDLAALGTEDLNNTLRVNAAVAASAAERSGDLAAVEGAVAAGAAAVATALRVASGGLSKFEDGSRRTADAMSGLAAGINGVRAAVLGMRGAFDEVAKYQKGGVTGSFLGPPSYWEQVGATVSGTLGDVEELSDGIASAVGGYSDLQHAMESYYESWRSQAEGILVPTQQFDLAALTEEVSGYQDQWDEAARRAMAVVKEGPQNEWAAQMGLGSREEALQYVRDFYAGKMPEAVNWDAAIATFQQQMEQTVGQQNLGAMFQQKLMEAGLGLDNELVMQAMGAPFAAAGAGSAEEFALAVQQYDWTTLGDDPGKSFATSFLGAAGSALSSPGSTAGFKNSIKSFIISTVQEYFFGGAKP